MLSCSFFLNKNKRTLAYLFKQMTGVLCLFLYFAAEQTIKCFFGIIASMFDFKENCKKSKIAENYGSFYDVQIYSKLQRLLLNLENNLQNSAFSVNSL